MSDKVTFTDIGGKTHTTDSSTYKKWEKAGNVKSSDYQAPPPRTPDSKPETKTVTYRDSSGKTKTTNLVTFIDTSGKEKTMTEGSYEHALNTGVAKPYTGVKLGDGTSTIGPETVDLMYQDKLAKGEITQEEYNKAISASYASEGTLLYTQALATDDKQLQKTAEERITDYIKMGKTTPQEIQTQLNQPYAQENYNYFKSGIINVNLPMQQQTITHTYSPLSNLYGQNQQSVDQLGLMASVNANMGMIIFTLSSDNRIVVKDGVSPDLYNLAMTKAKQFGLNVGEQVQVDTKPKQSLYSDNGEYNPSDIFFTQTETKPTDYSIDISNLHGREGTTDVLYETVGDRDIPRYKRVNGEFVPLTEINGQYVYIPEGYKYSSEGFLVPENIEVSPDGTYYQDDVYFKTQDGMLVPDYKIDVVTDNKSKTSKIDKQFFQYDDKTGDYYIQTITKSEEIVLPENFTKVMPNIFKKDSILGKTFNDLYKDTSTNIFYKGGKDNTLTPAFKIEDGKFIKATKVKTNIIDLLPDNYKSDFSKNIENLNLTSQDDIYMFIPETPVEEKIDPMLKYRENISMRKQIDEILMTGMAPEFKDIGRDIGYVRDSLYFAFATGKKQYEGFYDTTLTPSVEQFWDSTFFLPSKLISEGLEQSFGPNPISRTMDIGRQFAKDVSVELTGVFYKTPTKILGNFALGSYEYSIFDAQTKGGFTFEKDVQTLDLKFDIPFTNINIIDTKMDVPRSGLDSSVRFAEAGLYSTSVLSGVAGGITSFTAPTVATTTTTKAGIPLIFKSAGIGAGFGLGKVGFDISQGQSYTLEEAFRVIGKSTGTAMGFAGLSEVSKAGSYWLTQEGLFKTKYIPIKNPQLTQVSKNMKSDISFLIKKREFNPFIREHVFGNKAIGNVPDLKLYSFKNIGFGEQANLIGIQKNLYINNVLNKVDFVGRGEWSGFLKIGVKNIDFIIPKTHLKIDYLTKQNILSNKAQHNTMVSRLSYGYNQKPFAYELSESISYQTPFKASSFYQTPTKNIVYDYDISRSISQSWTIGTGQKLTPTSFLNNAIRTTADTYSFILTRGTSYSPLFSTVKGDTVSIIDSWDFKEPSINYYQKEITVKNSDLLKYDIDKSTTIYNVNKNQFQYDAKLYSQRSDIKFSKNEASQMKGGAYEYNDYTIRKLNVDTSSLQSYANQQQGNLGGYSYTITKTSNTIIPYKPPETFGFIQPTVFKPYVALQSGVNIISSSKEILLTNPFEIKTDLNNVYQDKMKSVNLDKYEQKYINRNILENIDTYKNDVINIVINPQLYTEKTSIIDEVVYDEPYEYKYTDKYIYETEDVIPIDIVDPIPPIPTPPMVLGGGWDSRGYHTSNKQIRRNLLERRVEVASVSAGVFGVKTKGLRGTSFDTRFEAVKNKVEQPKFISIQPKIKVKPFNKVVSKRKVKTPTIKFKQPKIKTIKIPKF